MRNLSQIAAVGVVLLPWTAFAQTPSSVQPGQVIQRFQEKPLLKPLSSKETIEQPSFPRSSSSSGASFLLQGIVVDDSTVYDAAAFEAVTVPYIHHKADFTTLHEIARLLTAKYRRDGYILSRVALEPQAIKNGIVHMSVIEGHVSAVVTTGDTRGLGKTLSAAIENIKRSKPLHARDVERALLLLGDMPGVTVRALFRPSPDISGSSQLVLSITQNKWGGAATLDNRGGKFLGPVEVTLSAAANGLMGAGSRTSLRGVSSLPFGKMKFIDATQEWHIGLSGLRGSLRAALSRSAPAGGSVSSLGILGDSALVEGRVAFPFVRTRQFSLEGYLGLHLLNASDSLLGVANSRDRVRTAMIGGEANFTDSWRGTSHIDLHAAQGLKILNATEKGARRSRANGDPAFTSVHAEFSRLQPLAGNFSLLLSLAGQYALQALPGSEEFSLGGAAFGRGYDSSEITGDHGIAALAEVGYAAAVSSPYITSCQLYGFYDIGAVWNRERVALDPARESLSSVGIGLRLGLASGIDAGLEIAKPLTHTVSAEGNEKPARIFFRLSRQFVE